MITKKITDLQLAALYKFTRKHFVEHFDVQTELVDHLANDIEQIWEEKPSLSFDEARAISFKKFGVFGFMDVVGSRTKAMSKKYYKIMFSILKDFFRLPQIMVTLTIFASIYGLLNMFPSYQRYTLLGVFLLFFIVIVVQLYWLQKIKKARLKESGKKWLFEEMILNTGGMASFSYLPIHFSSMFEKDVSYGFYQLVFFSSFLTIFIIVNYIVAFIIPSKMTELLEAQYPEYKMMA
ncbi:MAG: hypothetical protein COB60_04960 [Flavobacteriaceae bacterium]|nr:MAG: hypothetical protein COB60_04960 [Flavobacteriaceae bacterium]